MNLRAPEKAFWLSRFSTLIFYFLIALMLAGIYAAEQLPIAVFPDTDFPRVVIGVDNGVMPVEQMQVTITKPIEDAVNSVPGLNTVRSTTSRGAAEISLFFDWKADMFHTLQLVDAALSKVEQTLPATSRVTTNRLTFATFPILGYALTADDRGAETISQTRLWEIATYDLKPPLNRVDGVSTVIVQGGKVPEFHIVPDAGRLQAAKLTLLELVSGVQTANIIDSPGLYEADHKLVLGLVGAQAHTAGELADLVIKTTETGTPIRVADVATVKPSTMPVYTAVTANGKPAVLLNITRQITSNTVQVADSVASEVTALEKKLPAGVRLQVFYDQSQLIRESIASVRDAILLGVLLVGLILFFFLRDWRSSLVAALVIPVTAFITILLLWALGGSFNLMTLGGVAAAVGLVIDDAIVVVENVGVHRNAGQSPVDAVKSALDEIFSPLVGSTITPVVVFLPLIAMTGVTGNFFRALAVTMTAALLTSLFLALTWTPALSLLLSSGSDARIIDATPKKRHDNGRFMTRILAIHAGALSWSLKQPRIVGGLCLVLVAGGYFGYSALGTDLLPGMDEGGFILDYIMPAGTSLTETNRVLQHVEQILRDTPEVQTTSRRTGLQMGLSPVTEANTGDFTVRLKERRSRSIDAVMSDIREAIQKTEPELNVEFTQVLQDMIGDLSNAPEPIQIKLFSNDSALLHELGPRVQDAIKQIPGVVDTQNGIDNTLSSPATNFQISPVLAARFGFTPQEIAENATAILDGLPTINPMIVKGRPYTIRVRLPEENRASLAAIESTVFNSASGHTASLGSLAQVTQLPPQNEIRRENLQQLILVTGRLEGSDLGTAMNKVRATIANMHLPSIVRVEYGGTYEEQQKSFRALLRVLILALVLVFGVLLIEFRNFYAPIAILTSSILSIPGVLAALLITQTTFNVASFMGLIMVIGIVAKNGILLLDADEKLRAAGLNASEAMQQAAQRRLRPILMTAIAAISGMLPLAFALGAGSQMLQPLAIAVIGGVLISVVLSLIVTPLVYFGLTRERS